MAEVANAPSSAATILLVEDEADVRQMIVEALANRGLAVVEAANDKQAYSVLQREARSFQLLIADINLGVGTTGFDVARKARAMNPALQVVYITGHAAHLEKFGVAGGLMFPKPFYPEELADQIESLLRQ